MVHMCCSRSVQLLPYLHVGVDFELSLSREYFRLALGEYVCHFEVTIELFKVQLCYMCIYFILQLCRCWPLLGSRRCIWCFMCLQLLAAPPLQRRVEPWRLFEICFRNWDVFGYCFLCISELTSEGTWSCSERHPRPFMAWWASKLIKGHSFSAFGFLSLSWTCLRCCPMLSWTGIRYSPCPAKRIGDSIYYEMAERVLLKELQMLVCLVKRSHVRNLSSK